MSRRPRCRATPLACLLLALLVIAPKVESAAPPVVKIGVLTSAWSVWHSNTEGFRDGLRTLGYVEGRTVVFEPRAAQGDPTRLSGLAAELVALKPHLLFCVGGPEAQACQKAAATVPIVTQASDPVRLGLAQSLAKPGGNVTGVANLSAELAGKRLELFRQALPSLRRVLLTYDPREAEQREAVDSVRRAAAAMALTLLERPITSPLEIEPGLAELREGGSDGILIVEGALNLNIPGRSLEVATSRRLPTMYPASFWTNFGALASYGPDQYEGGRQAARLAHRILTGTTPAEIPIELPDRIEFIINLKTAKRLGLDIPRAVMLRADRLIE